MEKVKATVLQVVICIGLLAVIWGMYFYIAYRIDIKQYQQIDIFEDNYSWVFQADSIKVEDDVVIIEGVAFEIGADATERKGEIVLHETSTGENYFLKMQYTERKDVNDYFLCEFDYSQSGFVGKYKKSKIDLKNGVYEILLRMPDSQIAYRTGTYVSDGQISYTNPKIYESLDVAGTYLENVVDDGILRVYRPDYGVYVYQYNNELYWIVGKGNLIIDKDTNIEYHLYTTQANKLPEYRQENNWHWDNISFSFLEHEVIGLNTGDYRVAKMQIPTDYSITKILTGEYAEDWIWRQDFRPYYFFEK